MILFILDTKKTVIIYIILSAVTIGINYIYSFFGHGVSSDAMTWMFLYPLLGGAAVYLILGIAIPNIRQISRYRLYFNIYNSGIALMTVGSLLKGILEIAGTTSAYTKFYYIIGGMCMVISLVLLIVLGIKEKNRRKISC